jgi:glyoxylase-like metal-dependent hydrolase (beta-lactamase superfamily II)
MRLRLVLLLALVLAVTGTTQAQQPPTYETKKVTDSVYIFKTPTHQSMFVVTQDGVIATDPISPQAATAYLQEIQKVTKAPVRYVVYSHHHLDHIDGGAPFKQAGAVFVAHKRAKDHLVALQHPTAVLPDLTIEDHGAITVGGTTLDLHYVGRNHSDSTLVMQLAKEKIIFAVDFLPIKEVLFRNVPDSYINEWFQSINRVLALDWDKMIAGHPRQGGIGTKEDVRNLKEYMTDLSTAVKTAAADGKCFEKAQQEVKLPKYEKWGRYQEFLPGNIERFCFYWRNGWE